VLKECGLKLFTSSDARCVSWNYTTFVTVCLSSFGLIRSQPWFEAGSTPATS